MKLKIELYADREKTRYYAAPRIPKAFRSHCEKRRTRWDPKNGELCLVRTTLMEICNDFDVQIDRRNRGIEAKD